MKRGAERDLNKDNADIEESEDLPTEGFRRADESVLASRVIRSLPKRASSFTVTQQESVMAQEKATSIPKLENKAFSFTLPTTGTLLPGSTTSQSTPKPMFATPTVSSTASTTAKSLASFLNPSSFKSESSLSQPPQQTLATSITTESPNVDDPVLFKYYTSLRGLNVSLLDALLKVTDKDPFADISDLLDRYKSLRVDVQQQFDKSSEPVVPPKSTFMPTPPTKFSGFGPSAPTNSGDPGSTLPKATPSSSTAPLSHFTFALPPAPPATTSPSTFTVPPTNAFAAFKTTSNTGSSLPSGEFKFQGPSSLSTGPSASSFTFGGFPAVSEGKSPSSNPFTFAPVARTETTEKGPTFEASSPSETSTSAFNTGSRSPANAFGSDKKSLFAISSTPPQTNSGAFGGFGGFGHLTGAGGSIGNPVGFGFGSPPRTPNSEPATSEGLSSLHDTDNTGEKSALTRSQDSQGATDNKSGPNLLNKSPHDEEGEGEEQEDTVHAVKLKAFVLRKSDGKDVKEGPAWLELGYGVLRLKKHKETEARRILLRNSNTGKININFNLYSGFKPTLNKKALTFVGHDDSKASQTYSVRLQNEEQANTLKEALDKEAALISTKSDD